MVNNILRSGMPRFYSQPQDMSCADNTVSACVPLYPSKAVPAHVVRPTGQHTTQPSAWSPIDQVGTQSTQSQPPVDQRMAIGIPPQVTGGKEPKHVFLAVILDDNRIAMTLDGTVAEDGTVRQFFDSTKFQSTLNGGSRRHSNPKLMISTEERSAPPAPRGSVEPRSARKRSRGPGYIEHGHDSPLTASTLKCLRIDDNVALENFYENRFAICQQNACKLIAKAWVKAIEPRKQSKHPYTGSDGAAPEWWPRQVPHTEPDHLLKPARLRLLVHMLRLVIPPRPNQHHAIRYLGLNVARLDALAHEALSSHFAVENNAPRRRFLVELFKVARREERYHNGEIDGTTQVQVMADERVREPAGSDNDDGTVNSTAEDRAHSSTKHLEGASISPVAPTPPSQDAYFSHMADRTSPFHQAIATNIQSPTDAMNLNLAMHATHLASPHGEASADYSHMQRTNFYNQQWHPHAHTSAAPVGYGYAQAPVPHTAVPFGGHPVSMSHGDSFMEVDAGARTVYE